MKRLLVVDDDFCVRLSFAALLKGEGFSVATAVDGLAGYHAVVRLMPDLILCDVMMPIMNGLQLKQKLNQDIVLKNIPLVFLSGRDEIEDINTALSLGAKDYIVKPVSFEVLLSKVKSLLFLHRLSRANE